MIRRYNNDDRLALGNFFATLIEQHKDYISHGEIQMGVAIAPGVLAPNFKEIWLEYLDRQINEQQATIFIAEDENRQIIGFIICGIEEDGADPYGIIYDMGVNPKLRGNNLGSKLLEAANNHLRDCDIKDVYLESGVNNHLAHHFFEKRGFVHVSNIYRMKL